MPLKQSVHGAGHQANILSSSKNVPTEPKYTASFHYILLINNLSIDLPYI